MQIPHLVIPVEENTVPEGFSDWVKIGLNKSDSISTRVQTLLSNNELEEAIGIYNSLIDTFIPGQAPSGVASYRFN